MMYTLKDMLDAEEARRAAYRDAYGSERKNKPRRAMPSLRRRRDEALAKHTPLVALIEAALIDRADPEYLAYRAAQEAEHEAGKVERQAHEAKWAAERAEKQRIQDALHALYPVPNRGSRYEFEGNVYARREVHWGPRATYFYWVGRAAGS